MSTVRDQLTLGGLISALEGLDQEESIRFDFGGFVPGGVDSYRGYYDHLMIKIVEDFAPTVGSLLEVLRAAVGATFTGYKGGEYRMDESTPMWADRFGKSTGTAIVGVAKRSWCVALETRFVP